MADEIQGVSDGETSTNPTRVLEVLRDDIMVSISEGVYTDPRSGQEYEMTRSEVAYEGDQFDNLSLALLKKFDEGKLSTVFKEVSADEVRPAPSEDTTPPAGGGESDDIPSIDVDSAASEELAEYISKVNGPDPSAETIKVIGTGANGNVLKQDLQKAIREYQSSHPGA